MGIFLKTLHGVERATGALYALHGAVWLGLLGRPELNEVTARRYEASPAHTSDEYNRSGLYTWEQAALSEHFSSCRSFLVAGAGGGREILALHRRGLRADGFECNPRLLRLAERLLRDEGVQGTIWPCAAEEVPEALSRYEAGIVGFGVYMHIVGKSTRIRFLREFADHLVSGAPLLISYVTRGDDSRRDRYLTTLARIIRRLRGDLDAEVEIGDSLDETFTHRFTEREIVEELAEAGFDAVSCHSHPIGYAIARFSPAAREVAHAG